MSARRIADHPDRRIDAENAAELLVEVALLHLSGDVDLELLKRAVANASLAFTRLRQYEARFSDALLDRREPRRGAAALARELNDEGSAGAPDTAPRPLAGSVHGVTGDPSPAGLEAHETHGSGLSIGGAR